MDDIRVRNGWPSASRSSRSTWPRSRARPRTTSKFSSTPTSSPASPTSAWEESPNWSGSAAADDYAYEPLRGEIVGLPDGSTLSGDRLERRGHRLPGRGHIISAHHRHVGDHRRGLGGAGAPEDDVLPIAAHGGGGRRRRIRRIGRRLHLPQSGKYLPLYDGVCFLRKLVDASSGGYRS